MRRRRKGNERKERFNFPVLVVDGSFNRWSHKFHNSVSQHPSTRLWKKERKKYLRLWFFGCDSTWFRDESEQTNPTLIFIASFLRSFHNRSDLGGTIVKWTIHETHINDLNTCQVSDEWMNGAQESKQFARSECQWMGNFKLRQILGWEEKWF